MFCRLGMMHALTTRPFKSAAGPLEEEYNLKLDSSVLEAA